MKKNVFILLIQFSIDANELWNYNLLLDPFKQAMFIPSIFFYEKWTLDEKRAITHYNTNFF